jgi:FSR family fosmidomycin resistance protein-like MFS transporter
LNRLNAPIYQVVIAEYAAEDVHELSYGFTYLSIFGFGAVGQRSLVGC